MIPPRELLGSSEKNRKGSCRRMKYLPVRNRSIFDSTSHPDRPGPHVLQPQTPPEPARSAPDGPARLEDLERQHILETLRRTCGVISGPKGTATLLDLPRSTHQHRMRKLGIDGRKEGSVVRRMRGRSGPKVDGVSAVAEVSGQGNVRFSGDTQLIQSERAEALHCGLLGLEFPSPEASEDP